MAPVVKSDATPKTKLPRILVVDDERDLRELVGDVVGGAISCDILTAKTLNEARQILAKTNVELLVTDVKLPDGDGTSLLSSLRKSQPQASAIVITGEPSMDGAIDAIREGAVDFLPKPFTADHLIKRVNKALALQVIAAKTARRLDKLRDAVKRLNQARRVVSKKVDLLCNDLITAYGELSKQLDTVRTQEGFRKLLSEAKDLEQMLCHAMDWLLRQMGYSNVAIWLAGDDAEYQLGAYMKYTIPGDPPLTEALKNGLLRKVNADGFIHLSAEEAHEKISAAEKAFIDGQTVLGITCTYLGEVLASVIMFRDGKTPFSDDDAEALKAISPLFGTALATMVHDGDESDEEGDDNGTMLDEDVRDNEDGKPRKKRKPKNDADWWKRGEEPPF